VIRVLSSPSARLALSKELALRVQSNRAMLEHQQFELVVKLINCALQDDNVMDEYGVAATFLPLVTAFCRVNNRFLSVSKLINIGTCAVKEFMFIELKMTETFTFTSLEFFLSFKLVWKLP
jgi:hypothetical protein